MGRNNRFPSTWRTPAAAAAGPAQVGALGALSTVAFLLVELPAGAWVADARDDDVRR
ncbi:hypothetical protein [Saccharopolyspora shandongensis]|uniref:hypothetical protein n=1 Tax=Saccharopolyspora shandongensis TaxID=418495 RepID=UPI003410D284